MDLKTLSPHQDEDKDGNEEEPDGDFIEPPNLYCKKHQMVLRQDEEQRQKMMRRVELANFTRNLEVCIENLRRNQHKILRDQMGAAEYQKVFGTLYTATSSYEKLVRARYSKEEDGGEVVCLVIQQYRKLLNLDKSPFDTLRWSHVKQHQTSSLVSASGLSYKNLNGSQLVNEFKKLLFKNEHHFNQVYEIMMASSTAGGQIDNTTAAQQINSYLKLAQDSSNVFQTKRIAVKDEQVDRTVSNPEGQEEEDEEGQEERKTKVSNKVSKSKDLSAKRVRISQTKALQLDERRDIVQREDFRVFLRLTEA